MRLLLALITLFAPFARCLSQQPSVGATSGIPYLPITGSATVDVPEEAVPVSLGMGWDQELGPRAQCVKGMLATTGHPITSYSYYSADHTNELSQAMDVSADASLGIGFFSASANVQLLSTEQYDGLTSTLIINEQVVTKVQSLDASSLKATDRAKKAASRNRGTGGAAFENLCGDQFIVGIEYGGNFYGIVDVVSASSTAENKMKSDLSVSVGLWGHGSASVATDLKTLLTDHTVNYRFLSGGVAVPVPSLDGLMNASLAFPTTIGNEGNPVKLYLVDYGVVPELHDALTVSDNPHMQVFAEELGDIEDIKSQLLFSQRIDTSGDNAPALKSEKALIDAAMFAIKSMASSCDADASKCGDPVLDLPWPKTVSATNPQATFIGHGPLTIDAMVGQWNIGGAVYYYATGTQVKAPWRPGVFEHQAAIEFRNPSGQTTQWTGWSGQAVSAPVGQDVYVIINDDPGPGCAPTLPTCYYDNNGRIIVWSHR
jgi:hypothetical protein